MFAQFRLTAILAAGALALGLSSVAQGQIVTDVQRPRRRRQHHCQRT